MTLALVSIAGSPSSLNAQGAEIAADPSNYRRLLATLGPGDTLALASGTYLAGLPITAKAGTPSRPITILGPSDHSAVFKGNDCCNTVQLENVSHLRILNLRLDGANTRRAIGVAARGTTHHVTIENLRIVNYDSNQQIVGISTKGPAWNWVIRGNQISGAGTGMYLGDSDGSAPFVAGVIEYNTVLDTIGYNLQIKHQNARPSITGMPEGASRTLIRHNVFSKQKNASTGEMARPNVLLGHFPLEGPGAADRYEVYGNFFFQNPVEALFQAEGNLVVHDNLFVNAAGSAIRIQPHNDRPRHVVVYNNTIVARNLGISVQGADPDFLQMISGNAVFADTPIDGPRAARNVTGTYEDAVVYLNAPHAPIGGLDLYPRPGKLSSPGAGPLVDLGAIAPAAGGNRDFNGKARAGLFRGAYEGEGTNPGWVLALSQKPTLETSPSHESGRR